MKPYRLIAALLVVLGLTACAPMEVVSRNAAATGPLIEEDSGAAALVNTYTVTQLNVTVPRTLKVSEANSFYPGADIVWRGDPFGDRHRQIEAIFHDGMGRGIGRLHGAREVVVDIVVQRFHSVTERTRYTVGGVHSITFTLQVRDAATGATIEPPRLVHADLAAFGGLAAVRAEAAGLTQKVRITNHLEQVILNELGRTIPAA